MKVLCRETYQLLPEQIDEASDKLNEVLASCTSLKSKEILRHRLSMEEILLNWMGVEEENQVQLIIEQQGKKLNIMLEMRSESQGVQINPLKDGEEFGDSGMADSIMSNLGTVWLYQYSDGMNQVSIRVARKTRNQLVQLAMAMVLAIISGFVLKELPESVTAKCLEYVIEPVFDTFMGFLSAIVGPMMFLSVAWGILSIGNPRQLGTIGKKVCLRFLAHNAAAAVFGGILTIMFFSIRLSEADAGGGQVQALLDMLYDIIPDNLLTPFLSGNTMQIVFLAVVAGISMIVVQNQIPVAAQCIEQFNIVIQQILAAIGQIVPGFVYLSILRLVLSDQTEGLSSFLQMIVVYLGGTVLLSAYYILDVSRQFKVRPGVLIRKLMSTFLIAISTASSTAAFAEASSVCIDKLGINKKLVNFGLPLGIVTFMPANSLWMVLFVGACAQYYDRILTPVDLLMAILVATFLSVAAPPIPGGALTCYMILLMQMNIPLEILAIASTINFVLDFTGTAVHILANQTQLLIAAGKMDMADRETLTRI